jgi:hypothetical protein
MFFANCVLREFMSDLDLSASAKLPSSRGICHVESRSLAPGQASQPRKLAPRLS